MVNQATGEKAVTGPEFRALRKDNLKMSTVDLAKELGVSRKTIYNWEGLPIVPKIIEFGIRQMVTERARRDTQPPPQQEGNKNAPH